MALTDEDLDRMGDKMKLAVAEAMEAHRTKDHDPLWKKLSSLDKKQAYWAGGLAAMAGAYEYLRSLGPH